MIFKGFSLLCLLLLLSASPLLAFSQKHRMQLLNTCSCSGCDLSKINLPNSGLAGCDLTGANLKGANFQGSDLSRADLTGAKISSANFRGAKLYKTIWIDGKVCSNRAVGRCYNKKNK